MTRGKLFLMLLGREHQLMEVEVEVQEERQGEVKGVKEGAGVAEVAMVVLVVEARVATRRRAGQRGLARQSQKRLKQLLLLRQQER